MTDLQKTLTIIADSFAIVVFFALFIYMIKQLSKSDPKSKAVIVDTSGLIDGRLLAIVDSGFTPRAIIIPQFVINELQTLADVGDSMKRERARFGLDVVQKLQKSNLVDIEIAREKEAHIKEVDDKLVSLAKKREAQLYTVDFNLKKVAEIEGVPVLNVNELAQALRAVALPGEKTRVKIVQKGSNPKQGVGYLDDGTMIVVENAAKDINKEINVVFNRTIQTVAGKMLFADKYSNKKNLNNKSKGRKAN